MKACQLRVEITIFAVQHYTDEILSLRWLGCFIKIRVDGEWSMME